MNTEYTYVGCFISPAQLFTQPPLMGTQRLAKESRNLHVTFLYKPAEVDTSLFGKRVKIVAVAYGNNGVNEGLKVELYAENDTIAKMIAKIEVPHITLSVAENGESVNTRYIAFEPIAPFTLCGVFGGFTTGRQVATGPEPEL